MKTNDIILMQRADGQCIPALVVEAASDYCVARTFTVGDGIECAPLGSCAPMAEALDAFHLVTVLKFELALLEEERDTLKAQVQQLTAPAPAP